MDYLDYRIADLRQTHLETDGIQAYLAFADASIDAASQLQVAEDEYYRALEESNRQRDTIDALSISDTDQFYADTALDGILEFHKEAFSLPLERYQDYAELHRDNNISRILTQDTSDRYANYYATLQSVQMLVDRNDFDTHDALSLHDNTLEVGKAQHDFDYLIEASAQDQAVNQLMLNTVLQAEENQRERFYFSDLDVLTRDQPISEAWFDARHQFATEIADLNKTFIQATYTDAFETFSEFNIYSHESSLVPDSRVFWWRDSAMLVAEGTRDWLINSYAVENHAYAITIADVNDELTRTIYAENQLFDGETLTQFYQADLWQLAHWVENEGSQSIKRHRFDEEIWQSIKAQPAGNFDQLDLPVVNVFIQGLGIESLAAASDYFYRINVADVDRWNDRAEFAETYNQDIAPTEYEDTLRHNYFTANGWDDLAKAKDDIRKSIWNDRFKPAIVATIDASINGDYNYGMASIEHESDLQEAIANRLHNLNLFTANEYLTQNQTVIDAYALKKVNLANAYADSLHAVMLYRAHDETEFRENYPWAALERDLADLEADRAGQISEIVKIDDHSRALANFDTDVVEATGAKTESLADLAKWRSERETAVQKERDDRLAELATDSALANWQPGASLPELLPDYQLIDLEDSMVAAGPIDIIGEFADRSILHRFFANPTTEGASLSHSDFAFNEGLLGDMFDLGWHNELRTDLFNVDTSTAAFDHRVDALTQADRMNVHHNPVRFQTSGQQSFLPVIKGLVRAVEVASLETSISKFTQFELPTSQEGPSGANELIGNMSREENPYRPHVPRGLALSILGLSDFKNLELPTDYEVNWPTYDILANGDLSPNLDVTPQSTSANTASTANRWQTARENESDGDGQSHNSSQTVEPFNVEFVLESTSAYLRELTGISNIERYYTIARVSSDYRVPAADTIQGGRVSRIWIATDSSNDVAIKAIKREFNNILKAVAKGKAGDKARGQLEPFSDVNQFTESRKKAAVAAAEQIHDLVESTVSAIPGGSAAVFLKRAANGELHVYLTEAAETLEAAKALAAQATNPKAMITAGTILAYYVITKDGKTSRTLIEPAKQKASPAKPSLPSAQSSAKPLRQAKAPAPKGRAAADGAFDGSRSLRSGLQRQADDFECGSVCVEQYLRRQGIDPTDLRLNDYVDYDFFTGGTSPSDIVMMLADAKKVAKATTGASFDDLLRAGRSDIFTLVTSKGGTQHWVLIENVSSAGVRYFDPATGQRLFGTLAEFRQRFAGSFVH